MFTVVIMSRLSMQLYFGKTIIILPTICNKKTENVQQLSPQKRIRQIGVDGIEKTSQHGEK